MTITRVPGAQRSQLVVHFRQGDRATLDIYQSMGVVAKESDDSFFDMDCDAVAIMVILRRRNDRTQRRFTEFTDALQSLPDLT